MIPTLLSAASFVLLFFFSLTTDMNRFCRNPQVPASADQDKGRCVPGVRVFFFFAFGCLSISFGFQSMTTLNEGDERQMWEFIHI